MHIVKKWLLKYLVKLVGFFLPQSSAHALERWRRGREEYWKLQRCDCAFVSYGKSGRTWVRVMVSRYFQLQYQLPETALIGFDNYAKLNPKAPKIFFTHDNYLRNYTGNLDSKKDFQDVKLVLMVRKPQDVAVSQYFQWKYRMRPEKKAMNNYPAHEADVSVFDFVTGQSQGIRQIVEYMNGWAVDLSRMEQSIILRYEDLRSQPEHEISRLVEFLGFEPDAEVISEVVEYASVENMRKKEQENYFWRSGSRMRAMDVSNPNTFKVRKAKVGGYRDYFTDEQVMEIDAIVDSQLAPVFGYTSAESEPVLTTA